MNIILHYPPEKPTETCNVIVFTSWRDKRIGTTIDTCYSKKWDAFFMRDDQDEMPYYTFESNKNVVAWAYLFDVEKELFDEVQ